MGRKLVAQGNSTLMVSLPIGWIKENNLRKGQEVSIKNIGKGLVIAAEKEAKAEKSLDLRGFSNSFIFIYLTNAFRSGFDRIAIKFEEEKFKLINNIVKSDLIGFEITKKENNFCVIESVTEPSEEQFENILNKLFLSIDNLLEISVIKMKDFKGDCGDLEEIESLEEQIHRYHNFCRRILYKKRFSEQKSEFFWTFLSTLDNAQIEIYNLNKNLKGVKCNKDTIALMEKTKKFFGLIVESYKEKNINCLKLDEFMEGNKPNIYFSGIKGGETVAVYYILTCLRLFNLATSPLAGLI